MVTSFCVLLLVSVAIYAAPAPSTPGLPTPSCARLARAMSDLFWNYVVKNNSTWAIDQARYELIKSTGIDFAKQEAVNKFACKLTGVKSLHELADLLPISYNSMYMMYDEALTIIEMMGGINGYEIHLKVMEELLKAASSVGFPNPPMPLMVTEEEVARFLHHMVTEFGPDFLSSLTFSEDRILITNVSRLAQDLTKASDLDDLAVRTGFPPEVIHRVWDRIGYEVQAAAEQHGRSQRANQSLLHFLKVVDELGLLDLEP